MVALAGGSAFCQKKAAGQVKTVVIDAGHGGAKPGAVGKRSQEKNITLSIALKLGKLIEENYPGIHVIYTRTQDVDVSLSARAEMANKAKADLFLSIHCNSWNNSTPTGMETYVMGLSQSKANLEVAKKENADILLEEGYRDNSDYQGFDPNSPESYVMFAMYQNTYLDHSLDFAGFIQEQYRKSVKTINRGVKQAEIFVLYKTAMPSVLTEVGFISNPDEERYMMSDEGQTTIVNCIFKAFAAYKAAREGSKVPDNLKMKKVEAKTPEAEEAEEKPKDKPKAEQTVTAPSTFVPSTAETNVAPPLPMPEPPETPAPAAPAANADTAALPASVPLVYKVQFMTSNKEVAEGSRDFKGLTEYEYYMQKSTYCYTTGSCAEVGEASKLQKKVREMGFKDAFVVAFLGSERITLQKAKELAEERKRVKY